MNFKFLAFCFLAITISNCSPSKKDAVISVSVPAFEKQSVVNPTSTASAPATVDGFNCLILNVTGVNGFAAGQGLGLLSSAIPVSQGGTITLTVPFGSNIHFQMLGVLSSVGCPSTVTRDYLNSQSNFSAVVEVGKVIRDINGDTNLTITSTYATTYASGQVLDVRTNQPISSGGGIGSAPVRPTGTLGNFVLMPTSMPVAHEHSAALQIGNKIYLIGGSLGTSYDGLAAGTTNGILEATLDSNGEPSAFTKSPHTLTVARKGARAEKIGDYVYIFGGFTGSGQTTSSPLASIERATHDGTQITSSFAPIAETLAEGRYNFLTLVTPGYVYAIGGGVSSSYHSNTIERATVNLTTGEISSFTALSRTVVNGTTVTNGLVDERWTHNGIRLGDNFYILGGEGIDTIEKVVIQSDGTLGNFEKLSDTLVSSRNRLSIIALQGRAYVYGGWSGTFLTSVESAPIVNNELGTFTVEPGGSLSLVNGVENGTPLLTSQGVYLFGGFDGSTQSYIQRAPINP